MDREALRQAGGELENGATWWVKSQVILLGYRSKLWFSALTHPLGWTFLCGSLYSAQAGSEAEFGARDVY